MKFVKDILSHKKILPAPVLNAAGLQVVRILGARAGIKVRRKRVGTEDPKFRELERSGCVAFENFLPDDVFDAVREEFGRAMNSIDESASPNESIDCFGSATRSLPWIPPFEDKERHYPAIAEHVVNNPRIMNIVSFHEGHDHDSIQRRGAFKIRLERTRYSENQPAAAHEGEEPWTVGHSNSFWHRDTFHSITKLILYMNDVSRENGAFRFAPYSHRINGPLLKHAWKNRDGENADAPRISEQALVDAGFETIDMCFPVNTLIVADTGYGFHAKGKMQPGTQRDAIWIEYRTSRPFW